MTIATPATFLDLVQRTHNECGFTTDRQPVSVLNQNNMAAKLVEWVQSAHTIVQQDSAGERWKFDWAQVQADLQPGDEDYDPVVDFGQAAGVKAFAQDDAAAYVYKPATGLVTRIFLRFVPWESFRGLNVPQIQSSAPSYYWTQRPDGQIVYFPCPNVAGWRAVHECYLNPKVLVGDADTPRMPLSYRMAIVWRAVMLFCGNRKDGDLYTHAANEFDRVMTQMRATQLPQWRSGGSLA